MVYLLKPSQQIVRESTMRDLLGRNKRSVHESGLVKKPITRRILHQSFKSANEAFALMEDTRGIVVPYESHGKEMIAKLAAAYDLELEWICYEKPNGTPSRCIVSSLQDWLVWTRSMS